MILLKLPNDSLVEESKTPMNYHVPEDQEACNWP
jgi:hypothetical protein